jgi:hypothetical protein
MGCFMGVVSLPWRDDQLGCRGGAAAQGDNGVGDA